MKRFFFAAAFLLAGTILFAQTEESPDYSQNELYVGLTQEAGQLIVDSMGNVQKDVFLTLFSDIFKEPELGSVMAPFFMAKGVDLQWVLRVALLNEPGIHQTLDRLSKHPAVRYAERVPMSYITMVPNDIGDSAYFDQWHLYRIQAKEAWGISTGSSSVVVAIVDDAVQLNHADLRDNLWTNQGEMPLNGIDDDGNGYIDDVNGYDVGAGDGDPSPPNGLYSHGTHTSGIVGATTNNGKGIASIWYLTSIMAVKCTSPGQSSPTQIPFGYEGITYAANAGAHIINCSWGGPVSAQTALSVIQYAQSKGCIVVAAMGNDYSQRRQYPASYAGVISVIATNINDTKANYSNYFSTSTICAPGTEIKSTYVSGTYSSQSGTSMASPLVAGLLGLMKGHYPQITNTDLVACLLEGADNIDAMNPSYKGKLGAGRINAFRSMQCVDGKKDGSIPKEAVLTEALLYPNPAVDEIVLMNIGAVGEYRVYTMDGSVITSGAEEGARLELQLQGWASGMYILEWYSGDKWFRKKFIVNP